MPKQEERFAPTTKDGFRPRRKRTKADTKQLIKDGVVADPETDVREIEWEGETHIVLKEAVKSRERGDIAPYREGYVVDVPTGKAEAKKE